MSKSLRGGLAGAAALALLAVLPALASDGGNGVVVTKPGVVFHKAGSSDIRGKGVDKTVDAALESGYSPCPVCFAKELTAARGTAVSPSGGASAPSPADGIPVPPVVTVSQPFGVRYAANGRAHGHENGVRDPYADTFRIVPGRSEQGAYGER